MDESSLFSGAIIAVLGAGLGYLAARYQGWVERTNDRKVLATALLSELRWLEGLIRQVYEHGPASFYDPFDHPVLLRVLERLDLFTASTAERLSHFHCLLRDLRAGMNEYRSGRDKLGNRVGEYQRFLKGKAYFAAAAIDRLKEALVSEGGALPPRIEERTIDGASLPLLPPASFDSFDRPPSEAG